MAGPVQLVAATVFSKPLSTANNTSRIRRCAIYRYYIGPICGKMLHEMSAHVISQL